MKDIKLKNGVVVNVRILWNVADCRETYRLVVYIPLNGLRGTNPITAEITAKAPAAGSRHGSPAEAPDTRRAILSFDNTTLGDRSRSCVARGDKN
jgi:hypothetical protein